MGPCNTPQGHSWKLPSEIWRCRGGVCALIPESTLHCTHPSLPALQVTGWQLPWLLPQTVLPPAKPQWLPFMGRVGDRAGKQWPLLSRARPPPPPTDMASCPFSSLVVPSGDILVLLTS